MPAAAVATLAVPHAAAALQRSELLHMLGFVCGCYRHFHQRLRHHGCPPRRVVAHRITRWHQPLPGLPSPSDWRNHAFRGGARHRIKAGVSLSPRAINGPVYGDGHKLILIKNRLINPYSPIVIIYAYPFGLHTVGAYSNCGPGAGAGKRLPPLVAACLPSNSTLF